MEITVEEVLSKSKWGRNAKGKYLNVIRKRLSIGINVAKRMNIPEDCISRLVSATYDAIIDDNMNDWTEQQFLRWTKQHRRNFIQISEGTLIDFYRKMWKIVNNVVAG